MHTYRDGQGTKMTTTCAARAMLSDVMGNTIPVSAISHVPTAPPS